MLAARFDLPTRTRIDPPLLAGAALFGVGWGLSGLCPGPALALLATGATPVLVFGAAMLAGMAMHGAMGGRVGGRSGTQDAGGPAGSAAIAPVRRGG
jgi:uncharacterized protein